MYRGWTQTDYQNKHYNINRKDKGTQDDRGRDGGTNFILRIKEQETRLTLQEHDDDDGNDKTTGKILNTGWICDELHASAELALGKQETRLTLQEHDDDDDLQKLFHEPFDPFRGVQLQQPAYL